MRNLNGKHDSSTPKGLGMQSMTRPGFFRTILLWFIALSLTPLAIVSLINYPRVHHTLRDNVESDLVIAAESKADRIQRFFHDGFTILQGEARRDRTVTLLEDLRLHYKRTGAGPAEFVKSREWADIVEKHASNLALFATIPSFSDFLLVDVDGNILFSDRRKPDLGANIFTGVYANTTLGRSCRNALEGGAPGFSDFEKYLPLNNAPACFLISPVLDEKKRKIGLAAARIDNGRIDGIMQSRSGLGRGGETYLVGHDLRMRSNSALDDGLSMLRNPVETEITLLWRKEYIERASPGRVKQERVRVYTGRGGVETLGLHRNIEIAGHQMAVITEIPAREAFEAAAVLRNTSLVCLALTTLVVIAAAFLIAGRITRPLQSFAAGVRRLADGDLDHEIRVKDRGEIGELAADFNDMVKKLRSARETTRKWTWIKTGQTDLNDCVHPEEGIEVLCQDVVSFLTDYLDARVGAVYVADDAGDLRLTGSYALGGDLRGVRVFKPGEGLVGQAAANRKMINLTSVPAHYIKINSALGKSEPRNIIVLPIVYDREVTAVIELGSFNKFTDMQLEFLNQVSENIAIAVNAAQSRRRLQDLLEKTDARPPRSRGEG
ncbi:MAG: GAF domain-containing protein [Desulfobacterales bacterium]|nr:GAF domain-containing protein [Desulfobacterales bacterium]